MIRRKDSFCYIEYIRGKYILTNVEQIKVMFNGMTITEREKIKNNDFRTLWLMMWGLEDNYICSNSKSFEECSAKQKADALQNGYVTNGEFINLDYFLSSVTTEWYETEWEFPKGRRNYQEKEFECATREFVEETGIDIDTICIVENIIPFEELILGSNNKLYKNRYFLAYTNNTKQDLTKFQTSEVSKMEWKTLDACLQSIRPYNLEKKKLINNINTILQEYCLY
jgi:hypothetical protein